MPTPQPSLPPTAPLADTPRRRAILKQLRSRPSVKGSVIALVVLLLVVLLAPFGAPQNPYDLAALDLLDGRLPPGSQSMGGGLTVDGGGDAEGAGGAAVEIAVLVGNACRHTQGAQHGVVELL
jgi:peptide/nickel transport system permease protein